MTETMYARDLRVIWWPEQQVFELPDGDAGSWVVYLGGYQKWAALNQERSYCQEVSGKDTADEVLHGIVGEPDLASDDEVRLLTVATANDSNLWVDTEDGTDAEAINQLVERDLLELYSDTGDFAIYRLTARGVAKVAMFG